MPKLSELTDAYTPQETLDSFPVESPFVSVPVDADGVRRVRIDAVTPKPEGSPYDNLDAAIGPSFGEGVTEHPLVKQLFGLGGETRYQLWPERMVREGLSAAGDVMSGKVPQWAVDPESGDVHTSPNMVEKAQEMSALAGTGGLAGMTTDATLGATPFLRPALKYKDKLYKGKDGQQHLDVIPESIYPEFQKKAMSGEDINEFKFGFVNDKGHFLDRETALKYGIDTGLVDPAAGKFGALTSTLMADSSKPGVAIEAMKTANPFFSAVEYNVNAIPQAKMTGDQWLGTLSNKPGVKPEEMAWTGLQDFLMENKGKPVTKEQIVEHLNNNKVELKEKVSHTPNPRLKEIMDLDTQARKLEAAGDKEGAAKIREEIKAIPSTGDFNPRYKDYQLPGGENYREMLLTLPSKSIAADKEAMESVAKLVHNKPYAELTKAQQENVERMAMVGNPASKAHDYKSSHWDEPNILAHVRMNDRTIDGKKSLHLEEIQSDWHQQGRDKGYRSDTRSAKDIQADLDKTVNELRERTGEYLPTSEHWAKNKDLSKKHDALASELTAARQIKSDSVPDAPFKKSWHELALKRMLREAAEKGYDRLSWTPGEAQAARYDLSKSLDKVQYHADKQRLVGIDKKGGVVMDKEGVPPEKVADFVGKEAAKKLLESEPAHIGKIHELRGADLTVGGEGMKGFYDQIIPKALEKLGKEHGVKVQKGDVGSGNKFVLKHDGNTKDFPTREAAREYVKDNNISGDYNINKVGGSAPVHYIDIPQSLKDQAMHKGFPLFSAGGHMLIPVSHDPFKDETK